MFACIRKPVATLAFAAGTIGVAVSGGPAAATSASFSFPPAAASLDGVATAASTIFLPPTGNGGFRLNFILPLDYRNNRPVAVILHLSLQTAVTCAARLVPVQLTRRRVGHAPVTSLIGVDGGDATVNLSSTTVVGKVFTIKRNPNAFSGTQRSGDSFVFVVQRQPGDATDTCNSETVVVSAIDIRYPLP